MNARPRWRELDQYVDEADPSERLFELDIEDLTPHPQNAGNSTREIRRRRRRARSHPSRRRHRRGGSMKKPHLEPPSVVDRRSPARACRSTGDLQRVTQPLRLCLGANREYSQRRITATTIPPIQAMPS